MKRTFLVFLATLMLFQLPLEARSESEGAANVLLVESVGLWSEFSSNPNNNFEDALVRFILITRIDRSLSAIVSQYPTSDLAVKLVIGESVGPLSLAAIQTELAGSKSLVNRLCFSEPTVECVFAAAKAARHEITDDEQRARTLSLTIGALLANRVDDTKVELAQKAKTQLVDSPYEFAETGNCIARALAKLGRFSDALALIGGSDRNREHTLAYIAGQMAKSGEVEDAISVVADIPSAPARTVALTGIAKAQAAGGATSNARATFFAAISTAESIADKRAREVALSRVLGSKVVAGILEGVQEAAVAISDDAMRRRVEADLLEAQLNRMPLENAIDVAETKGDEILQVKLLCSHASGADPRAAARILEAAYSVASSIDDSLVRARALRMVARKSIETSQTENVLAIAETVIALAGGIQHEYSRFFEVRRAAGLFVQAGETVRATEVVLAIDDPYWRAIGLAEVASWMP